MSPRIEVAYGQQVKGRDDLGFDSSSSRGRKLHLVPYTATVTVVGHSYSGRGRVALCGMDLGPHADPRWASGYLCPSCAKAANVESAADLEAS